MATDIMTETGIMAETDTMVEDTRLPPLRHHHVSVIFLLAPTGIMMRIDLALPAWSILTAAVAVTVHGSR